MIGRRTPSTTSGLPHMHHARRSLVVLLAAAAILWGPPRLALAATGDTSDIVVHAQKVGDTIVVEVDCPVDAPRGLVWDVLTDYDHMAKFIPNLEQSAVRARMGNRLQVFQKGKASRGPLSIAFENVREIELVPQVEIRSRMVSGDMMPAGYTTRIVGDGSTLHIVHTGSYTPSIWVPPVVGPALIEAETRRQYGEIRDEVRRRAAATKRAP